MGPASVSDQAGTAPDRSEAKEPEAPANGLPQARAGLDGSRGHPRLTGRPTDNAARDTRASASWDRHCRVHACASDRHRMAGIHECGARGPQAAITGGQPGRERPGARSRRNGARRHAFLRPEAAITGITGITGISDLQRRLQERSKPRPATRLSQPPPFAVGSDCCALRQCAYLQGRTQVYCPAALLPSKAVDQTAPGSGSKSCGGQ